MILLKNNTFYFENYLKKFLKEALIQSRNITLHTQNWFAFTVIWRSIPWEQLSKHLR